VEPDRESHTLLDLGDDRYTRGRPHPMIDPTPRCEKIVELGSRPETALLLLDLVLGHGCHPDPAAPAAEAVARAVERNPGLVVVASITGTDLDPQNFQRQEAVLERAGVQVLPSAAAAASFAGRVIQTISDPGKTREAR
jgi:FdrA protein